MTEYGPGTGGRADGETSTGGGATDPTRPDPRAAGDGPGHADGRSAQEATDVTDTDHRRQQEQAPPPWASASNPTIPAHGAGSPPTSVYPPFPAQAPAPKPPRRFGAGLVTVAVAAGLIGGGVGFGGAYAVLGGDTGSSTATLSSSAAPGTPAQAADGSIAGAAAAITPSTVDIQVRTAQGTAEGSGVILTADGEVLTNNHVVSGAGDGGQITVSTADGTQHRATVVGTSPSYDLAVIRLEGASDLKAATLGQSSGVQVGEQVVATGSPQGLSGTVTAGIVSALNRTVSASGDGGTPVVYNGLQTDAPINQGNSGGPLVNLAGQVVGINSAIATSGQNAGSIGLGFAIPVDTAKRVAQKLMSDGVATKPQLGVQGSVSASGSETAGTGGAQVAAVEPGSPAANAGVAAGDVVTKVDEYPVSSFADLIARVGNFTPGQQVTLTIGSGADARQVPVTLGSAQDTEAATARQGALTTPEGSGQGGGSAPSAPFGINPFGGGGN
ncbi:peptidase S1 and S6, chymotrypsin/Hap [Pseudonocardia sp. Ae168_Ps1]|uniref:S1C family serine protease n=1 Tax=unclassified Pseudonocardia TaxID=2619320 RepID=UPI00094AAEE0|nr:MULTISPECIES: trypsin-like peptidase domain-containing protein [unclassified Pseudonocardia]OLL76188.1 peptidase S1 and S6, chymotrypsin/Hap [Pseudonocardia sp. Ae150A_Ps1]OLL82188.1 peptidase S1 and S6, chymotrypsin/Hap [Pseudonocardia sp. Ae168_Ps1]OLL83697.1 peptidase S1 and S6, chymotrypsin/Hap [Pseudonocardia sp. Ae263_Ps1]OLL90262.1 peptidase S1 and S6, chymotrypsin/Hap [Pseudonocardia sp. Ae356_Ps1]